ncbi:MAG: small multi-drug export protein [Lachnospiraceae bacterium]|nr:small multi-drug export protein [Lachnospiraceae bacterium]
MVEELVNWFMTVLGGMPRDIIIFVISLFPILELRGGLIAAALLGVPIVRAIIICVIGNILPIPFILLLIKKIFVLMKKVKFLVPMVEWLENKAMGKSEKVQKYEFWGLMLFVGIPLPGTGAWTGALIAALLDVKFSKAITAILCGIVLATIIMCTITYLIPYLVTLL